MGRRPHPRASALSCPSLAIYGPGSHQWGSPGPHLAAKASGGPIGTAPNDRQGAYHRQRCQYPEEHSEHALLSLACCRVQHSPTGRQPFRYHAWRGNPSGEEVRDGPHNNNRCGGNRGGVAPTAASLKPRVGLGLSGSGLIMRLLVAASFSALLFSTRPSLCDLKALRGTSGGASMTPPGGAGTFPFSPPRARRTGLSQTAGALRDPGLYNALGGALSYPFSRGLRSAPPP